MANLNIKKYEEALKKTEAELQKKLGIFKDVTEMGSDQDAYDTETDEAEELVTNEGEKQILKERLEDVEEALRKIKAGMYGKCERCGEMIEEEVLDVAPESRCCKVHKVK